MKLKPNQNKTKPEKPDKTDKNKTKEDKNDKIDKYLVKYKLRPIPKQEGEEKPTKPKLPTPMSLREKIEKFSSISPPKLSPTGGKIGTKPKPSHKAQDSRPTTTINKQQQQATEKQQQVYQENDTKTEYNSQQ